MKIGTVSKITVGAAAIIGLGLIGTRHFILSKEDSSPTVEIVTSTLSEATHTVRSTNATRGKVTAPRRVEKPQITAAEMEQIESFFAHLEADEPSADEYVFRDHVQTETETAIKNDSQQQLANADSPDIETSSARDLYIQKRLRQVNTELPQMINEWKQINEEINTLSQTLSYEVQVRIVSDLIENMMQLEDELLRLAFDYMAFTGDVETLNEMFEGTIWSFE